MNKNEFIQTVWDSTGRRVTRPSQEVQIEDLERYKVVEESPVNRKRSELIEFIQENKNRLSLPCDGDCHNHHDGVVLYCYTKLLEDNNGRKNKQET